MVGSLRISSLAEAKPSVVADDNRRRDFIAAFGCFALFLGGGLFQLG